MTRTRLLCLCLATAALIFGQTSNAADQVSAESKALWSAALPKDGFASSSSRTELIGAASAYCAKLKEVWPTNSPSEEAWLDNEVAATGSRVLHAITTREFARRRAAVFIANCLGYSSESGNRGEAYALVGLGFAFSDFSQGAERYATTSGIDPAQFGLGRLWSVVSSFNRAALRSIESKGK